MVHRSMKSYLALKVICSDLASHDQTKIWITLYYGFCRRWKVDLNDVNPAMEIILMLKSSSETTHESSAVSMEFVDEITQR